VYDQYSFQAIPVMGQLIAGQWKAYQYLVESIRQFPNQVRGDQYACLFSPKAHSNFSNHSKLKIAASNLIVSVNKIDGIIIKATTKLNDPH
jgi:hypothetical protein